MRVVDEHECKYLLRQHKLLRERTDREGDDGMAVQAMVEGQTYLGWFLVNYRDSGDIAFGITHCPYCGKELNRED